MTAAAPSPRSPWRRWRTVAALLAIVLAAVVIRDGADRRAADATRPLVRRQIPDVPCERDTLRLVSFNIHGGKGDGKVVRMGLTAETLGEFDVAGLFEVRAPLLAAHPDQAADLAQRLNCGSVFVATETHWWRDHFGNALLTRCALGPVQRIPLPNTRGKAFRNLIHTEIPWRGRTINLLATHVDSSTDRVSQLALVLTTFLALEQPAVLMGDLNTTVADPLLVELLQTEGVSSPLHDALPDGPPADTIDWIFVRGLRTVSAELIENPVSDHPVLRVELALPVP
jgi:endonuclease/exonuclease/phosphatase family metal-dependent hydrolase